MNFYVAYYELFRAQLVRFAFSFTKSFDSAEDLFEDSHLTVCKDYLNLPGEDHYVKLMKKIIETSFVNLWRHTKVQANYPYLPLESIGVDEVLFQKMELEVMRNKLKLFNPQERKILLSDQRKLSATSRAQKSRAKEKLQMSLHNYFINTS